MTSFKISWNSVKEKNSNKCDVLLCMSLHFKIKIRTVKSVKIEMAKSFFGRDHEGYIGKKDHAVCDCLLKSSIQYDTHSIDNIDFYLFRCSAYIIVANHRNSWIGL